MRRAKLRGTIRRRKKSQNVSDVSNLGIISPPRRVGELGGQWRHWAAVVYRTTGRGPEQGSD